MVQIKWRFNAYFSWEVEDERYILFNPMRSKGKDFVQKCNQKVMKSAININSN